jgi:hypothetical protein
MHNVEILMAGSTDIILNKDDYGSKHSLQQQLVLSFQSKSQKLSKSFVMLLLVLFKTYLMIS